MTESVADRTASLFGGLVGQRRALGAVRLAQVVAALQAGRTQSEIGRELGISRQRVWQLVARARQLGMV